MLLFKKHIVSIVLVLAAFSYSSAQDTRLVEWYVMESTNFSAKGIPSITSQLFYNLNNRFAVGIDYYSPFTENKNLASQVWNDNTASFNSSNTIGTIKRGIKQYGIVAKANLFRSSKLDISISYILNYAKATNSISFSGSSGLTDSQQNYLAQQLHSSTGITNGLSLGLDFNYSRSLAFVVRLTNYNLVGSLKNKDALTIMNTVYMQDGLITNVSGFRNNYFPIDISVGVNVRFGYKKL